MAQDAFIMDSWEGGPSVAVSDPGLDYLGRLDWADPQAPVFIWQASELRASFFGPSLSLGFDRLWGRVFFNVVVDDEIFVLKIEPGRHWYSVPRDFGPGPHSLSLYKRSEAFAGYASFLGLGFSQGQGLGLGPRPEPRGLRLEFYGDSITAGACNEDPGDDQYDDLSSHNHARSYPALCARSLGAEEVSVAVSGIGICESWDPRVMGQIWDKMYVDPSPEARRWDFSGRHPDIVVINIGQNDFGFPNSQGRGFPEGYKDGYMALVRGIRQRYGKARIICALGGMRAYHECPALAKAFTQAVEELRRDDQAIYPLLFKAYSHCHPRVEVHERMAAELCAFIVAHFYKPLSLG